MSEVNTFLVDARENMTCKHDFDEILEHFIENKNLVVLEIHNMISKDFCEYYGILLPTSLDWTDNFSFNGYKFSVNGNCLTGEIKILKK